MKGLKATLSPQDLFADEIDNFARTCVEQVHAEVAANDRRNCRQDTPQRIAQQRQRESQHQGHCQADQTAKNRQHESWYSHLIRRVPPTSQWQDTDPGRRDQTDQGAKREQYQRDFVNA